jgi:uncharacterized surface protein with fasciclin (FAS1) repeats
LSSTFTHYHRSQNIFIPSLVFAWVALVRLHLEKHGPGELKLPFPCQPVAAGQFKTLAAALEAAGLIDALTGKGPFTVFAPTDEAFAKLPAGTVESLLKPENKEKLKSILLYHVVPGSVTAKQVMKLNRRTVKTLEGGSIKVSTMHGVTVDDARVTKTDIHASNGVIHVIDTVLMPNM